MYPPVFNIAMVVSMTADTKLKHIFNNWLRLNIIQVVGCTAPFSKEVSLLIERLIEPVGCDS